MTDNEAVSPCGGSSGGGAIYNGGSVSSSNSTLVNNSAGSGGGIYDDASPAGVNLLATLLSGNEGGNCYAEAMTDDGYNIDDDGSCGFTLPSISDYQTFSRTLGPLANNGGPTQTIALLPANPAIDYVPSADCPATDQRGDPRTAPCDIGAYDTDTPASQTITFTSSPPSDATVGGPTYTVSATGGGSGNPVTFTIDSSATSVCSITGSVASFTGEGTCTIDSEPGREQHVLCGTASTTVLHRLCRTSNDYGLHANVRWARYEGHHQRYEPREWRRASPSAAPGPRSSETQPPL